MYRLLEQRSTAVNLRFQSIHEISEEEAGYQASLQCLSCILLGSIRQVNFCNLMVAQSKQICKCQRGDLLSCFIPMLPCFMEFSCKSSDLVKVLLIGKVD